MSQGGTFAVLMYRFMSEALADEVPLAYATGAVLVLIVLALNLLIMCIEMYFTNRANNKRGPIGKLIDFIKLKRQKAEVENAEN